MTDDDLRRIARRVLGLVVREGSEPYYSGRYYPTCTRQIDAWYERGVIDDQAAAILREELDGKCPQCGSDNLVNLCGDCMTAFGGDPKNYEQAEIVYADIPANWNPLASMVITTDD